MVYWLTTAALSPLLLAQGLVARSKTPLLPEPPGERVGSRGAGRSIRVLITGDSAAAGVGAPHQEQALLGQLVTRLAPSCRVAWRLVAKTGATTSSTCASLAALNQEHFDVAVTSLGVNDVTGGATVSRWRSEQARLRALLRDRFKTRLIVVSGLPPGPLFPALPQPLRWHLGKRARQLNRSLQADVQQEADCAFVSLDVDGDPAMMASDGFHPGPPIYALWANQVSAEINENFGLE